MPNYVTDIVSFIGPNALSESVEGLLQKFHLEDEDVFRDVGIYSLDFNKIVPMPESLDIVSGSYTNYGYQAVKKYFESLTPDEKEKEYFYIKKNIPTYLNIIRKATSEQGVIKNDSEEVENFVTNAPKKHKEIIEKVSNKISYVLGLIAYYNIQEYGSADWYDWRCKHWGTKWNACCSVLGRESVCAVDFLDSKETVLTTVSFETAWSAPFEVLDALSKMHPELKILLEYADEDLGSNCGVVLYKNGEAIDGFLPETYKEGIELALAIKGYSPKDYGLCLNRTETNYVNVENTSFQVFDYKGTEVLFVDSYYTEEDTPKDVIPYYVIAESQEKFLVAPLGKESKEKVLYTIFTDYKGLPEKDIFEIAKKDFVNSNSSASFDFLAID